MTLLNFFDFLRLKFYLTLSVSIKENKSESSSSHFFSKVIINQDSLPDRGRELEDFERNPDSLKEIFKDLIEYEVIQYEISSYCDVMESIFNHGTTYIRSRKWALWIKVKK